MPWLNPKSTVCAGTTPSSAMTFASQTFSSSTARSMPAIASSSDEPSIQGIGNHWNPPGIPALASGRVGGEEGGARHVLGQRIGQPDQIGGIGPVAMQEDHQPLGRIRPAAFVAQRHRMPSLDLTWA